MRFVLFVTVTAVMLSSAGCMKVHIDTVITADGGGTATIALAMNRQVADAVRQLGELDERGQGDGRDLAAIQDLGRDQLAAACLDAGVRLTSHDLADDERGVRFEVRLAFDRIADLSRALSALDSDAVARRGEELRLTRTESGDFLLANAVIAGADTTAAPVDLEQTPDPEFLLHFKVLLDHVGELDIRRTITVPGEVISSNALEVEGRTSIWVVNAANMLEQQDTGLDPRIIFAGEGLRIEVPEGP